MYKSILTVLFTIMQTGYSAGIDFMVSIEGESAIPSSTGGDYTAVVKRTSDKKVIDSPRFVYKWFIESDNTEEIEFNIAAPDLKTTGLTLKGTYPTEGAVCGKLSCEVSYKGIFKTGAKSVRITAK